MNSDDLHREMLEYHLRVEEVLSGMDQALTSLANRVLKLEAHPADRQLASQEGAALKNKIEELEARVRALGEVVIHLSV